MRSLIIGAPGQPKQLHCLHRQRLPRAGLAGSGPLGGHRRQNSVFGHAALNASTGSLVILTFRAGSTPDGAFTSLLGFPGWVIIAVIVVALLATGQFARQLELAPSSLKKAPIPAA